MVTASRLETAEEALNNYHLHYRCEILDALNGQYGHDELAKNPDADGSRIALDLPVPDHEFADDYAPIATRIEQATGHMRSDAS